MSERSEAATPKRIRQARTKGQVAVSRDAVATAALSAGLSALFLTWNRLFDAFKLALATAVRGIGARGADSSTAALAQAAKLGLKAIVPVLTASAVAAALVGALLTNFLVAPAAALPRLDRFAPLEAIKRFGKPRTYLEPIVQFAKGTLLLYIGWQAMRTMLPWILGSPRLGPVAFSRVLGEITQGTVTRIAGAALVFAGIDVLYRRWQYSRDLRMTKQDVKREHKESDGNPEAKSARERLHREILMEATLHRVRSASFVVTNPTHYAVALAWDEQTMETPEVIAKGEDEFARRIIAEAHRAGVAVLRDAPLARSLHDLAVGDAIPDALYEAVATVVAYLSDGRDPDRYGL